ncbi:hypothetical protein Tco_1092271 [Tanacetum coccineum]|uniref:Uncharacterized protein n=1 Tax=Tanacetum coccineum TaxID=301880 RepID=A0ABQ5I9F5_9ASTR
MGITALMEDRQGQLKATRYLDFGLEELVPYLWVESEREYDISAVYGITHWWFRRKEFYINKHSEPSDREAVRSQMRILSVISVKDFKNLSKDFEISSYSIFMNKGSKHLPKTDKTSLHTAVNMWIRNLDASDYYFKEDYTIVPKPIAVVYRDINDQRKLMRLNELHKFSDGTLTRVMEKDWTTWVAVSSSLRLLKPKRTIESRAKRSSINLVRTQHPSETMVFHNEDGNPTRANIKQALGYLKDGDGNSHYERPHKGVKASANSDIMYFFTSAQDGDPLQDDVRLCLGDDLKKAQDHNQRQV